jgi:3-dehydroquinate dehydratase/shikimate dehydrogenase
MTTKVERVCVVIGRTRHKMVAVEIQEAAKRGATMLEVRLDFLAKAPDFKRLLAEKPCPMVATVRRREDGGRWTGTEEARQMLLRQAHVSGFDWVDLETEVADEIRRFKTVKRIVSYHNMQETPRELSSIYQRMANQDPDVIKLAVTAQTPDDNLRVLELLSHADRPTIAHCMGEIGYPSRILSLRYPNVPFIYAAFNKERGVAPGLPSFDAVRLLYHPEHINLDTQVFGVIGDPVAHSLSPVLHNTAFRKLGVNAVYLPFRVAKGQLPPFLHAFESIPVRGYSVTIPHKEAAASAAREHDRTVDLTHAANTLIHRAGGGFNASNTDYTGVVDLLYEHLTAKIEARPVGSAKPVGLVVGAGGAGRAVAHALHGMGLFVLVANRTMTRATKLAEEVHGKAVDWEARHGTDCEIVVNCTPVGMYPDVDHSPIHASFLKPGLSVFDTVYTPETTLLVREAKQRGCHVITGVDLFVRQAALQFQMFTGKEAPLELLYRVVRRALSPVTVTTEEEA